MIRRFQSSPPPEHAQKRKLAVITCHYNFAGFKRPQSNLRRFLRQMERDGVPVYGVELCLPGQQPVVSANPNWETLEADPVRHVMWQKEALLNLALQRVPADYNAIAWIDGDIFFHNPEWRAQTEAALSCVDVVQPFSEALWTDEDGSVIVRRAASTAAGLDLGWKGHPGFAWAARREVLDRAGGLYPWCIVGNGDTFMALGFFGLPVWDSWHGKLGASVASYEKWKADLGKVTVGTVHGEALHEWHGHRQHRRYADRTDVVRDLDIATAAPVDAQGLLSWHPSVPLGVRAAVAEYFSNRKEDGHAAP